MYLRIRGTEFKNSMPTVEDGGKKSGGSECGSNNAVTLLREEERKVALEINLSVVIYRIFY